MEATNQLSETKLITFLTLYNTNMIFKSINSVMPSRKTGDFYDFGDVPNKEDVILVVIKKEKGKLYLDILETTTQENPSLEFELRELTIKELKEQIEKLDKMFN